jgi:hypothetical protein
MKPETDPVAELAARTRPFVKRFIELPLPHTPPGLRRCRMCWVDAFLGVEPCPRCGSETVGISVASARDGWEQKVQEAFKAVQGIRSRRAVSILITVALLFVVCLLLLRWSAWTIPFLPIPVGLGLAAILGYWVWTRRRFDNAFGDLGQRPTARDVAIEPTDELMPAFLARNRVPLLGRPAILLDERDTLALLLSRKGISVEPATMPIFLDACCLRRDWLEFSGRMAAARKYGANTLCPSGKRV